MALGADVKFGLSARPHPVEIVCPHELQCPLTQGIFLDPVIASDGQVRLSVLLFGSLRTHPAYSILTLPSFPLPPTHHTPQQVYERQAILSYIHTQQHGTHLGYQPGPFRSPVGRGATAICPEVEPFWP